MGSLHDADELPSRWTRAACIAIALTTASCGRVRDAGARAVVDEPRPDGAAGASTGSDSSRGDALPECPAPSAGEGDVAWVHLEPAAGADDALLSQALPGGDIVFVGADVARYGTAGDLLGRHPLPPDLGAVAAFSPLSDGTMILLGVPSAAFAWDHDGGGPVVSAFLGQYTVVGDRDWLSGIQGRVDHLRSDVRSSYAAIAGDFRGAIALGLGEPHETRLTDTGPGDVFVASVAGGGDVPWAHRVGSDAADAVAGVATCRDGSVALLGDTSGTLRLDPDTAGAITLEEPVTGATGTDSFLVRFDRTGAFAFGARTPNTRGGAVAVDSLCDVVATGDLVGDAVFPSGSDRATLSPSGASDAFVASYGADGALEWIASVGGTGTTTGRAVVRADDGTVYVGGSFVAPARVRGASCAITLDPEAATGLFVAAFGHDGEPLWARALGVEGDTARIASITLTPDRALLVVGTVGNALHFPGDVPPALAASGNLTAFLMKMSR